MSLDSPCIKVHPEGTGALKKEMEVDRMTKRLREILSRQIEQEKLTFGSIFTVQSILFVMIYGIMLIPRFSTDSYAVFFYTNSSLNGILELGRTGTYFLDRILLALGVNSVTLSPLFTAVFILTLSWSASMLLSLLKPAFHRPNLLTLLFLEFGVLLAYANIYFAELFFFSDVALMYTFAVLFLTLALILFFHRFRIAGTILALVCLYLSLSFYQAFLGFFMIFGSMLILIRHDISGTPWTKQNAKPLFLDFLRLIVVGGGGSGANVLVLGFLTTIGFTSSRGPALHMADILNSIQQTSGQFLYYYPAGYPNYLPGSLKIIFILSSLILLCLLEDSFSSGREYYPFSSVIITFLVLFAGFLSAFAPHFIAKSVWVTPRSICSFFAIFTVMAVVIAYNHSRNGKAMPFAGTVVVLLFLAVNIVCIQGIALDQMEVNRQDKREAEEIIQLIQEYEKESGQRVDTISWRRDSQYIRTHPGIQYTFMDMNIRAGARAWSLVGCIGYYAGRQFRSENMPDEILAAYFPGQEWDCFQPEEQIRFEGNKMYLMVY